MAEVVYALCAITSLVCAALLYRGFRATRTQLLFWSSLCFAALALNNLLLFIDLLVVTEIDLSLWRSATALAGTSILVFGLVWESK